MDKKNRKKRFIGTGIAIGGLVTIIVFILFFVAFAGIPLSRLEMKRFLNDLPTESNSVPAYVVYGELHVGDEVLDISGIVRKKNSNDRVEEILCVTEEKAYFIYTNLADATNWKIASIDLKSSVIHDCCNFLDVAKAYTRKPNADYSDKMGYCYNDQIVLNDFSNVFVYDITTKEISQYKYEDYIFPLQKVSGKCTNETLELQTEDTVHTFTLEDMASNSSAISKIYTLKDKHDWQKNSYLSGFFSNESPQVVENKVYYIASITNWHGEPYAIILEYDFDRNEWVYVMWCFVGSDTHRHCYVVPKRG